MIVRPEEKEAREIYKLMIGLIGPRPIGWISTISKEGKSNLAPYSFFNMFSMNPAVLGFSPALNRSLKEKDSLRNVKETQCFVHNIVTKDLVEPMNESSAEWPHGVSEFEKVGLTEEASEIVAAARVKEAAMNVECELLQVVSFGSEAGNGQLVLGKVVAIHINRPELLAEDGYVKSESLELIGRLGRTDYMNFGQPFSLPRPKV